MERTVRYLAAALIAAACGGGSGDETTDSGGPGTRDGGAEVDPSVATVSPANGPLRGGDPITITGMELEGDEAVFVLVGDRLATDVTIGVDGEVTALTPPGVDMVAVDVVLFNSSGFARAPGAYTYNPAPTVTSVEPLLPVGGGVITIVGTGFTANDAGDATVTVGGAPCAGATAASDTSLTCTAPAGTTWSAPLLVDNRNGAASGHVRYGLPDLLAFDGRGSNAGSVYTLTFPDGVSATPIAALPEGVTGVELAPDGRLIGFESVGGEGGGTTRLFSFDLAFAMTELGPLSGFGSMPDAALAGGVLYAWTRGGTQSFVRVDVDAMAGTRIDPIQGGSGGGLAAFSDGKLFFTPAGAAGPAYLVDPIAGTAAPLGTLVSVGLTEPINSLTFHGGVLYGSLRTGTLITIDPTTLVVTSMGTIPGSIDALFSANPNPPVSPTPPVVDPVVRSTPPIVPVELAVASARGGVRTLVADAARTATAIAPRVTATTCAGQDLAVRAPVGGSLAVVPNRQGAWKVLALEADGRRHTVARGICRVTEVE